MNLSSTTGSASRNPPVSFPPADASVSNGRNDLRPCERITIPSATPGYETTYVAGAGDSWCSIAQRWQVGEQSLRHANTPTNEGQRGAQSEGSTPSEVKEGIGSFVEGAVAGDFGDNQSWSATAGQVAVGFIPIVGQIADARDTLASAKKVWNGEEGGWLSLGSSIVGWVPGVGDAAKAAIRGGAKAADAGAGVAQRAGRHGDEVGPGAAKKADDAAGASTTARKGDEGAAAAATAGARRLHGETSAASAQRLDREIAHARANGGSADDIKLWERRRADNLANVRNEAAQLDGAVPGRLMPNSHYELNGYKYTTDTQGRIKTVEGELRLEAAPRNRAAQGKIGAEDGRLSIDEGGHLIGAQFGGYRGPENLSPMNGSINDYPHGEWGAMEKRWANALTEGKSVSVKIDIKYADDSMRASEFNVTQVTEGRVSKHRVANSKE